MCWVAVSTLKASRIAVSRARNTAPSVRSDRVGVSPRRVTPAKSGVRMDPGSNPVGRKKEVSPGQVPEPAEERRKVRMSRRRRPEKREILPDPKFGDLVLSKFMNSVMLDGKKSVAEGIVYGALDAAEAKAKKDPMQIFHDALNNIKPGIEIGRAHV